MLFVSAVMMMSVPGVLHAFLVITLTQSCLDKVRESVACPSLQTSTYVELAISRLAQNKC
jgi:hypothetical protein